MFPRGKGPPRGIPTHSGETPTQGTPIQEILTGILEILTREIRIQGIQEVPTGATRPRARSPWSR